MIVYLHINGEIGDLGTGNDFTSLANLVSQYQTQKKSGEVTGINVTINSPGGSLKEGKDMYEFLTGLKKQGLPITTKGVGIVGSSATQPFLAGDVRILEPDCDFFIHNPQGQPPKGDADFLAEYASAVKKEESKMLGFYVDMTEGDKTAIQKFMENETKMSAQEAIDLGFATEVAEPMKLVAVYQFEEKSNSNKPNNAMSELTSKFNQLRKDLLKEIKALTNQGPKDRLTAWNENSEEKVTAYVDLMPSDKSVGEFISVNVDSMENLVGGQAVAVDAEGNFTPLPAGEYALEDGSTLVVGENAEVTEYSAAEGGEDPEEMEALKKELETAKAEIENLKKENEKLVGGVSNIEKKTEKKLEEASKIVEEAEALKTNLTAIATQFKIPKDRLLGKQEPKKETAAERITAIQSGIKKPKSIKEQLTA